MRSLKKAVLFLILAGSLACTKVSANPQPLKLTEGEAKQMQSLSQRRDDIINEKNDIDIKDKQLGLDMSSFALEVRKNHNLKVKDSYKFDFDNKLVVKVN